MRTAIIGGTGFDSLPGHIFHEQVIETPFGRAKVFQGEGENEDLFFLARHGSSHGVPPHRINYRANIKALDQLGVGRVLSTLAVGSLRNTISPLSLIAIDQFIDLTHGRNGSFYDETTGFAHTEMTEPMCAALRTELLRQASERGMNIIPYGTYVCTDGPRLETAAEIRMCALMGGDVVGMTGVPEIPLARELGLHYAAVGFSVNYAAGLRDRRLVFHETGLDELRVNLISLFVSVLRSPLSTECDCERSKMTFHAPEED